MKRFVLDSYALMALTEDEPGAPEVQSVLEQAAADQAQVFVSLINLGETLYHLERRRGAGYVPKYLNEFEQLPLTVIEVTRERVYEAAHLKARYPISYVDAFAAALALELDAAVLTSDPEFRKLDAELRVQWLPPRRR